MAISVRGGSTLKTLPESGENNGTGIFPVRLPKSLPSDFVQPIEKPIRTTVRKIFIPCSFKKGLGGMIGY